MKVWILSDLHIEQCVWELPRPRPMFDVLVAAGDIHTPLSDGVAWLAEQAEGKPVVYVPGNHEWYAHRTLRTVPQEDERARERAAALGIHLLQENDVTLGGVRFLGTTLWTDYALFGTPQASMWRAAAEMNDHRVIYPMEIRRPLLPAEALEWHQRSLLWLTTMLRETGMPTVVVTHHLPDPRSVDPHFKSDPLTPAYCSNLSQFVETSGAKLWIHGHSHSSCDYQAGGTRVVCNPKGYGPVYKGGKHENPDFNPCIVANV